MWARQSSRQKSANSEQPPLQRWSMVGPFLHNHDVCDRVRTGCFDLMSQAGQIFEIKSFAPHLAEQRVTTASGKIYFTFEEEAYNSNGKYIWI